MNRLRALWLWLRIKFSSQCPDCEFWGEDCDAHYFEGDPW
jgi:hypothetical protein